MNDRAPIFGGPCDGAFTDIPGEHEFVEPTLFTPRQFPGRVLHDDYLYVFTKIDGRVGWHFAGKVTWDPEEKKRREAAKQRQNP